MNIIDAWKQAKEGQRYKRKDSHWFLVKSSFHNFTYDLSNLDRDAGLADDWEVVKEKKKEMAYKDFKCWCMLSSSIPDEARITIEWEA